MWWPLLLRLQARCLCSLPLVPLLLLLFCYCYHNYHHLVTLLHSVRVRLVHLRWPTRLRLPSCHPVLSGCTGSGLNKCTVLVHCTVLAVIPRSLSAQISNTYWSYLC